MRVQKSTRVYKFPSEGEIAMAKKWGKAPKGAHRPVGFGRNRSYPPGKDGSTAGPSFNLYTMDLANPCTRGFPTGAANANKSTIVFFAGSAGLYRNGALVGGLGVSGDGVEEDDYLRNGGALGFEAPASIPADLVMDQGVRLPYFKFPRNLTN
jgi:hypothetical protein